MYTYTTVGKIYDSYKTEKLEQEEVPKNLGKKSNLSETEVQRSEVT
jgi:hypothetical protein